MAILKKIVTAVIFSAALVVFFNIPALEGTKFLPNIPAIANASQ